MSVTTLSRTAQTGGLERYLGPAEEVRYVTRRHVKVLDAATGLWITALALWLGSAAASEADSALRLTPLGVAAFLAASGFLLWKGLSWWTARYVFTTQRVLLIEGVLSRKVNGIPLRLVIDTVYKQPVAGRLLGYGHLELNLSGKPGLRTLTWLPDLDRAYKMILILSGGHDGDATIAEPNDPDDDDDSGWSAPSPAGRPPLFPVGSRAR